MSVAFNNVRHFRRTRHLKYSRLFYVTGRSAVQLIIRYTKADEHHTSIEFNEITQTGLPALQDSSSCR